MDVKNAKEGKREEAMIPISVEEILNACSGQLLEGNKNQLITNITTDSRSKERGLFIAIRGERFDGHDFTGDFFKNGGHAVIAEKKVSGKCVILVDDTKKALRDIAAYYRCKFNIPIVAVTGSVGKTSTKDMLSVILSQKYNTHKTMGNFNNEIGLPLTIFGLDNKHQMAVVEMGMNNYGEISRLTAIAKPSVAVITNIGTAHIGNLGSQEGILKAKLEILEGLSSDGLVILNGDDKLLYQLKGKIPYQTVFYGIDNINADLTAYDIVLGADKTKFKVNINGHEYSAVIHIAGKHHIYNALAGIIAGLHCQVNMEDIINGISRFTIGDMRQNIITVGGVKLIVDCYNASTQSMDASLKVLKQIAIGRTIAVLGDMLEMGDYAQDAHKEVGQIVANLNIDLLVTVGNYMSITAKEAANSGITVKHFENNSDAGEYLLKQLQKGDTVLFKASRTMKLEEISKAVIERLG